jgi:hypothetical protein
MRAVEFRLLEKVGFLEFQVTGVLQRGDPLGPDVVAALRKTTKVLFDFEEVEDVKFDPTMARGPIERAVLLGYQIAIVAANPAWFGVGRQIASFSGVGDEKLRVFKDRPTAVAWLLCGSERIE